MSRNFIGNFMNEFQLFSLEKYVNLGNELPKTNRIGTICLFRKYITNFEMLFDVENYQKKKKNSFRFYLENNFSATILV